MTSAITLRFTTQMQYDISRMTAEMSALQQQVSTGVIAGDLQGYGADASRLVDTRGLRALSDARGEAANQMIARFSVQSAALSRASEASRALALSLRNAVADDDGQTVDLELNLAFGSVVSALNETWNGQPLFAGERIGAGPIKVGDLQALVAAAGPDDIFDEANRHQVMDLGLGAPVALADKASEISGDLMNAMRDLKLLLDSNGGQLGEDLTQTQRDALQALATRLESSAQTLTAADARAGQLEQRLTSERARNEARSNLLSREIGDIADADIPRISIQLATLQAQYQATAKVFSDLSKLTLLDYL